MVLLLLASALATLLNLINQLANMDFYTDVLVKGYFESDYYDPYYYPDETKNKARVFIAVSLISIGLFVASVVMIAAKKYFLAPIFTLIGAVISTFSEGLIWGGLELPGFYFVTHLSDLVNGVPYENLATYLVRQFLKLFFYALVAISIFALVSGIKPAKQKNTLNSWAMAAPASDIATQPTSATPAVTPTNQKESKNMTAQWQVMIPGVADPQVDTATLQMWAISGQIKATTLVKEISTGATFNASQIPGVFSDKQYSTALILSILLGGLGVDRFYTGHVGLGIGKLLTAGGCGIWSIVDIILFATRKVNDAEGKPLS